ncbi:hypothetical protein [Spirosoma telluris]|uniref:hypothetical protein n=1 Tax=Spirosoma telluris TaxID=2183553 RepID=UPI0013146E7A
MTPDERNQITRAIVKNALLPSLEVLEGDRSWVDGDFNWTQVCHAGLTVGALAIAEREPELAKQIINRAIKNLPHAGAVYAPDGAYPEGPVTGRTALRSMCCSSKHSVRHWVPASGWNSSPASSKPLIISCKWWGQVGWISTIPITTSKHRTSPLCCGSRGKPIGQSLPARK